jgi:histone H3/H4
MTYRKRIGVADVVNYRNKRREKNRENRELLSKSIKKIRAHYSTKEIRYPEFKECFDYVDDLFPFIGIKDVVVYKASHKYLEKLGFKGVDGLYEKIYKTVVFTIPTRTKRPKWGVVARNEKDEVLVHELIHYCCQAGNNINSVDIHEEFAYGWSYGYLKNKGYTDDKIIDKYLPHLFGVARKKVFKSILSRNRITEKAYNEFSVSEKNRVFKKYAKEIYEKSLEVAKERGRKIVKIYCEKCREERVKDDIKQEKMLGRYGMMDI